MLIYQLALIGFAITCAGIAIYLLASEIFGCTHGLYWHWGKCKEDES
jgi:hypothetical protein